MDNFWQPDKIQHYKVCYNLVSKCPKVLRLSMFHAVVLGGAVNEVYHKICGRPDPIGDAKANYYGAKDALDGKQSRF